MKNILNGFVVAFILLCLPILISCDVNSSGNLNKNTCNITFDFSSEFGQLSKPEKEGDYYSIKLDGFEVAKIDTCGVNILDEIECYTDMEFFIYTSINSYDIEIKINGIEMDYETNEQDIYKIIKIHFNLDDDINFYMNGCFELMY